MTTGVAAGSRPRGTANYSRPPQVPRRVPGSGDQEDDQDPDLHGDMDARQSTVQPMLAQGPQGRKLAFDDAGARSSPPALGISSASGKVTRSSSIRRPGCRPSSSSTSRPRKSPELLPIARHARTDGTTPETVTGPGGVHDDLSEFLPPGHRPPGDRVRGRRGPSADRGVRGMLSPIAGPRRIGASEVRSSSLRVTGEGHEIAHRPCL